MDQDSEDVFTLVAEPPGHVELDGCELAFVLAKAGAVEPDLGERVDGTEMSHGGVREYRSRLEPENPERAWIRPASEVLPDHLAEFGRSSVDEGEERHRRAQFQVIGRPHDLGCGTSLEGEQGATALQQSRAEDGVVEVGSGFVETPDCVFSGHGT